MPNVRAHDMITLISGVALLPAGWLVLPDASLATALTLSTAHIISGLAFSPDLDIAATNYRRWGPLRILWWPYQAAIPHRSWLSHSLVIGPLLRLTYFLLVASILVWCLLAFTDNGALWTELQRSARRFVHQHPIQACVFLLGFVTGGAAHTIPDRLSTGTKRSLNRWIGLGR
jgi:uncharacterized metal-binding protein